ncbi:MAG: alpha/beta hydrolase [Deltaproteobacteria bacterium]|nr:alpha/beta hydrolase [Deltaproteobacteria bacterium]
MSRPGARAALALAFTLAAACGGDGAPGGRSFVDADPGAPGPVGFTTASFTFTDPDWGDYPSTAFVPAADGNPAPWPAIVLLNGFFATAPMMSWYSEHLASHGYLVLGVTPPTPFIPDVTEWARGFAGGARLLLAESADPASPLAGLVDESRLGAIGLSMGGAGALEEGGTEPALFRAIVALAPGWSDLGAFLFAETLAAAGSIEAPTQIQRGSQDCLVPADGPLGYYDAVPAAKQYLEINGGNHIGYINEGLATAAGPIVFDLVPVDCPATTSYAEQHRLSAAYATMWLDKHLHGTGRWDDALLGAGFAADLSSGTLTQGMIDPAR